jgi:hypothetical protein
MEPQLSQVEFGVLCYMKTVENTVGVLRINVHKFPKLCALFSKRLAYWAYNRGHCNPLYVRLLPHCRPHGKRDHTAATRLRHVVGSVMATACLRLCVGVCHYGRALTGRVAVNIDKLASL